MRLLLTTPTYPPFNSGLGNAVRRQADALTRRGHEVTVATAGSQRSTSIEAGVRIERFAVTGASVLRDPIRGDTGSYLEFLAGESCDALVMHAWQTWSTDLPLRNLNTISARKFVYSHCISTNMWLSYRPFQSLASYLLWRPYWWALPKRMRQLDGLIFLAEHGSDSRFDDVRLARRLGLPVHVVANSLSDGGSVAQATERDQIIAVGSFTKAKGFDFVLKAYAKSMAKNRLPLLLFGQEHTSFLDHLRTKAISLGIDADMLRFHTGVAGAALAKEYARARLFLSGSRTECQPLVLLDAMASGTPFVARATGCISSMKGGIAVCTLEAATREINRLLADEQAWRSLSIDGSAAAAETYNIDRNIEKLLDVLEGRSRAGGAV